MNRRDEPVEIEDVIVKAATDKALLCLVDGGDPEWIPRSQILEGSEVHEKGDEGWLIIPRWLAIEKMLVEDDDE